MARKKKRKDKGLLEYISPKNRKNVKALIRELGLELISLSKTSITEKENTVVQEKQRYSQLLRSLR